VLIVYLFYVIYQSTIKMVTDHTRLMVWFKHSKNLIHNLEADCLNCVNGGIKFNDFFVHFKHSNC